MNRFFEGNTKNHVVFATLSAAALCASLIGRPILTTAATLSASLFMANTRKQENHQHVTPPFAMLPAHTALTVKPKPSKTLILVDGDNISCEAQAQRLWVDYSKILQGRSDDGVVEAIFFTGMKYSKDSPYARFLEKITNYGYHIASNPRNKSNRDLAIQLKLAESAHDDDIAKIVLLSGDGDFCEVVDYAKQQGKCVEVMGFPRSTSHALRQIASSWIDLTTLNICKPKREYTPKPNLRVV